MENHYERIKELKDIPSDIKYEGYIWLSDSDKPNIINGTYNPESNAPFPFIIEGNLIAQDKTHSISIRFVDGEYIIGKVNWQVVESEKIETVPRAYLASNKFVEKKLLFKEAWLPVTDELCNGFPVLQPAWLAFVGFAPDK